MAPFDDGHGEINAVRRGFAQIAAAAAVATVACSLIYRPSDYFDPSGQLVVIANTSDDATAIVLTSALVVYTTSTGIYAFPKIGGTTETLSTFSSGAVTAIASNGTDLVAFCGTMGEFAWRPGWTEAQLIDGPTGCLSIDVHDQNIAATTSADADAGTYRIVLYRATELGFEVDIEGGTSLPPDQDMSLNERVSLTSSDVYFASGQVIGRKRKSSDDSNIIFRLRPDAACELGLGGRAAVDFRVVEFAEAGLDGGTDAGLLVLYRGSNGFRLGRHDDTCCIVGDEKDVCPEIPLILNSGYQAIVIHEPYVYYLPENELLRASIMDPDDAATLIRGNLGEVVGSLAIDDQYAYFGVANRILRLALPP